MAAGKRGLRQGMRWGRRRATQTGTGGQKGSKKAHQGGQGQVSGHCGQGIRTEVSSKDKNPAWRGWRGSLGWEMARPRSSVKPGVGWRPVPLGGQPRISGGGGGRQGGGVWAVPSPKRCSPRRLGLANSYSVVAGWACGTERPDMSAEASAALVRGAAPTEQRPLQLPGEPGLGRRWGRGLHHPK